ncbi:MAG: type II toxin-antitoxin system VapC family toxin [Gammaproteobacteria bacterium]|nr:type II toxin-antitoxin system VapC family toxin [Gammaproteobacteria bacterium]
MVIDTSALLAILLDEPEAEAMAEAIEAAADPVISAATLVELNAVIAHKLGAEAQEDVEALLAIAGIQIEPFTAAQARLASDAYARYGKGLGQKARLNLGDCFSYALAADLNSPLLFKGEDFANTDLRPAAAPR